MNMSDSFCTSIQFSIKVLLYDMYSQDIGLNDVRVDEKLFSCLFSRELIWHC
jgi:hypothetical protein